MKPGTIVRLPDGREGTVVFNGLTGYGIIWGRRTLDEADLAAIFNGNGATFDTTDNVKETARRRGLLVEAMLREPFPGAEEECVGEEYAVVAYENGKGAMPSE